VTVLILAVPLGLLAVGALAVYLSVRVRPTSGRLLEARRDQQPLVHELPYWQFLEVEGLALAINVDLTYSTFLRLTGVDADCLDGAALGHLSEGLHTLLQNLTPSTTLQFLH